MLAESGKKNRQDLIRWKSNALHTELVMREMSFVCEKDVLMKVINVIEILAQQCQKS